MNTQQPLIQSLIPNPEELQKQVAKEFNEDLNLERIKGVDMQFKKGKLTLGEKVGLMKYKEIEIILDHKSMSLKFQEHLNHQLISKIKPTLKEIQDKFHVCFITPIKINYLRRKQGVWYK